MANMDKHPQGGGMHSDKSKAKSDMDMPNKGMKTDGQKDMHKTDGDAMSDKDRGMPSGKDSDRDMQHADKANDRDQHQDSNADQRTRHPKGGQH